MVVSSCFVSFGEVNKTKNGTMEVTRRCRIKRLFSETPQGVEGDKRYMRKVYNTLSEDNRKKLEVYAAALRRTQLAHEGAD